MAVIPETNPSLFHGKHGRKELYHGTECRSCADGEGFSFVTGEAYVASKEVVIVIMSQ